MTKIVTKSGSFKVRESYETISKFLKEEWIELTEEQVEVGAVFTRKIFFNVSNIDLITDEFEVTPR